MLLELKHKHDLIMKSQQKNKSSLSRRSSSTGSHGKVVRRASLSERTNMYRREYEKEAVVWQCLVSAEAEGAQEEEEGSPDLQRSKPLDPDPVRGNHDNFSEVQYHNGFCSPVPPFYCSQIIPDSPVPTPLSNGSSNYSLSSYTQSPVWSSILDEVPITLSELKRQRMAAKQNRYLTRSTSELLGSGNVDYASDPGTPPWCSNGTPVYYTPTSGDPPILRLKATSEEEEEEASKILRCCRLS